MSDAREQAKEFADLVLGLFSAFGRNPQSHTIKAWAMALGGLSLDQIRHGMQRAMQECEQLPAPAVVRRFAMGSSESEANAAWQIAMHAVSHVGYIKGVCFEDATINATIRAMGGWPKFCESLTSKDEVWVRKRFVEEYATWVGRVDAESGKPLEGEGEQARRARVACKGYRVANKVDGFLGLSERPKLTGEMQHTPRPRREGVANVVKSSVESSVGGVGLKPDFGDIGETELKRRKDNFLKKLGEVG